MEQQRSVGFDGHFDWKTIATKFSDIIKNFDAHKCLSLWYFLSYGIVPDEKLPAQESNIKVQETNLNPLTVSAITV